MSTFVEEFADLLPDTVQVELANTRNAYDEITFSQPTAYQARIVYKSTVRRRNTATEYVSALQIIIATSTPIPLNARITLPDNTKHLVKDSEFYRDETNAAHHATIYLEA